MNEGGVKSWEPHQVQSPLAFSDDEEEDLLEFIYKYKAPRRTELPLEVHGVRGCGLVLVFALRSGGPENGITCDHQHSGHLGGNDSPPLNG